MMRKMTINAPWSIFYEEFFMNSFHYEIFPGPKDSYKNILLNLVKPLQITYLTTDKMFFPKPRNNGKSQIRATILKKTMKEPLC